jgi:hypothetical protein
MRKHIKGRGLWVLAALLIGAGLLTTGVYASGITVKAQPLQNTGANRQITYSPTWSSAAAAVTRDESSTLTLNGSDQVTSVTVGGTKASGAANVKVDLLDASATILDTATVALPSAAGTYSTVATLTSGTIPYRNAAKVAARYTAPVTVQLTSVADTYVAENSTTTNFGTATTMQVQSRSGGVKNRRSLAQFDISSIPAGSTIDSASLRLCATAVPAATRTYNAHQVTAAWVETTVTWANQPTVAASATASATTPASASCMTWTVTADVAAWMGGTANNGWRISDSVENNVTLYTTTFRTREETIVTADRPRLDVTYTAP